MSSTATTPLPARPQEKKKGDGHRIGGGWSTRISREETAKAADWLPYELSNCPWNSRKKSERVIRSVVEKVAYPFYTLSPQKSPNS